MQPQNSPENSSFHRLHAGNGLRSSFSNVFCYPSMDQAAFQFSAKSSDQARAFSASENHKEAERKRRERINAHLDSLRMLLLCNSKTDKASLLSKVVQRVRELDQQTSEIIQFDQTIPSGVDKIEVSRDDGESCNGKSLVKASVCCEDRIDLIPDLIEILRPLKLIPLRAEMATIGGRIRNVMVLAAGENDQVDESVILLLKDALNTLVSRSSYERRRMSCSSIHHKLGFS